MNTGIELTAEDLRDLIIAYDGTNEIEDVANALLNADTSVSTTPDGDSIVGRLNRIWNVIYRHSRFYGGGDDRAADGHGGVAGVEAVGGAAGQADGLGEMDSQLARFHARWCLSPTWSNEGQLYYTLNIRQQYNVSENYIFHALSVTGVKKGI